MRASADDDGRISGFKCDRRSEHSTPGLPQAGRAVSGGSRATLPGTRSFRMGVSVRLVIPAKVGIHNVIVQNSGGRHCEALAPWQSRRRSSHACPEGLPRANGIDTLRSQYLCLVSRVFQTAGW